VGGALTPDLVGMPMAALTVHLATLGVPAHHAARVFSAVHRGGGPLTEVADLGRYAAMVEAGSSRVVADVVEAHRSDDTTVRLVIGLGDGARVEAVLVPMKGGRTTLCVSTQVGCAMACAFCATGTLGLARDLTAGEIVGQVHAATRWAGARPERLVFMGMGEPLHAYASTADALRVLLEPRGLGFGSKQIMVSTVGLPARMRRFSEEFEGRVGLALSLHAGTDATRRRLIPAARATSLAELKQVLLEHPLPGSRALMLEVVVLPGVNDTPEELAGIAAFADGLVAIVNLLPFNPFPGAGFRSPTTAEVTAMYKALKALGAPVSVRMPRGREASGACGQLMLAAGAPAPGDQGRASSIT
jgi:23S rRNA (adenine2503-C2)-methyltransferase